MEDKKEKYITPITLYVIREILVVFLWIFIFVKLLIFDFDIYFFKVFVPSLSWIIDYKFIILIVTLSIFWIISNKSFFRQTIALLIFYPLFLLFWRIPRFLFKSKSWVSIFGSINIIVSFLKNIKLNFIIFTIVITSIVIVLFSQSTVLITIAMISLFLYLIYHFAHRVYYSFAPSKIFAVESNTLISLWETHKEKFYLPNELKNVTGEEIPKERFDKWSTNLQLLITFNKLCYFVASKLKSFQKSRTAVLYFIIGVLFTLFITIIIFAFINYGLYKIDPLSFDKASKGGIMFFIYYSFNTILTNSIFDFNAVSSLARTISSIEIGFGILILVILFFIKSTVQNEKYNEEINNVITAIEKQGNDLEKFVGEEFNLSLDNAISEIEKIKGAFIKIIYYFTKNIK